MSSMKRQQISVRHDQPLPTYIREQRARNKSLIARFACNCGAEILRVKLHTVWAQSNTAKVLVEQAHRKHQAEMGCTEGIA